LLQQILAGNDWEIYGTDFYTLPDDEAGGESENCVCCKDE
jgi:hypothetical protein